MIEPKYHFDWAASSASRISFFNAVSVVFSPTFLPAVARRRGLFLRLLGDQCVVGQGQRFGARFASLTLNDVYRPCFAETDMRRALILCAVTLLAVSTGYGQDRDAASLVLRIRLENEAITPVVAQFLERAIKQAEEQRAQSLVVELSTPGGYLDATERIVTTMFDSPVPIVVYVSPSGARSASAGVFVTMAAHVAAMAPATHIGAAHPVQLGMPSELPGTHKQPRDEEQEASETPPQPSVMEQKILNDTVARARAIAEYRGRNAEWAAAAVAENRVDIAKDALAKGVVDIVAKDVNDLLEQIDGRSVTVKRGGIEQTVQLHTKASQIRTLEMWWGEKVLAVISNPNVAMLLLMFGVYGILYELYSPGWGVSGTLGVVSLVLAFFGLSVLPINYAGLALVAVALCLFAAEAFVTSYGALTVSGIVCLILGGTMLVDTPHEFLRVSQSVLIPIAVATGLIVAFLLSSVVKAQRSRVLTGGEGLIGLHGTAPDKFSPRDDHYEGQVFVRGEIWRAVSAEPIASGQAIEVDKRQGLTLTVSGNGVAPQT
jgi:membrane-bound serine protease (ClpP class)